MCTIQYERYCHILFLIVALSISIGASSAYAFAIHAQDKKGKGAKNIVIALYPTNSKATGQADVHEAITQKNTLFDPFVTVVQKGASVSFPNKDKTRHHVYSFSKAKQFELPLFLGNSKDVTFDQAGIVALGCNIHDWMLAYLVVVDTPYFGKTDEDGSLNLDVPAGHYSLKYWYPGIKGVKDDLVTLEENLQVATDAYTITIDRRIKKQPKKPANAGNNYQ